jgi:hypothetical protein
MQLAAIYAICVGAFLLLQWLHFVITKQVSEFKTEPIKISLHLSAEVLTAIALVVGGWGLLTNAAWGVQVHLVSMGMLLYSLVNGLGPYVQIREWSMVGIYGMLVISALVTLRLAF